jgi:hypothetical protein
MPGPKGIEGKGVVFAFAGCAALFVAEAKQGAKAKREVTRREDKTGSKLTAALRCHFLKTTAKLS